jgi:hypothetical protein
MPLTKSEPYTQYESISKRSWKTDTAKILTFLEDDRDAQTQNGLMYLFVVKEGKETEALWVKPQSALAIGLAPYVPLKGKTLKILKSGSGLKDTRYTVEVTKA